MISNQNIQISIDELKAITKVELCVFDVYGKELASTCEEMNIEGGVITAFVASPADSQIMGEYHLLKVMEQEEVAYVVVAIGEDNYTVGRIAASQMKNLAAAYRDKIDRSSFLQNADGQSAFSGYLQQGKASTCGRCCLQGCFPDRTAG